MKRYWGVVCGSVFVVLGAGDVLGQTRPSNILVAAPFVGGTQGGATQAGAQAGATQPAGEVKVPAAVAQALQLPKGDERKKALTAAAQEWSHDEPAAALAWAVTLPREDGSVSQSVFDACSRSNGKVVADWIVQQNSAKALAHFHGVMYGWAMTDHAAAAAWCENAPKNVRYLAYFSVGDGWLVKDSAGASAWAASLKPAEDRGAAIYGVALKWGRKSIPEATVWIKGLKADDAKTAAKAMIQDRYNKFSNGGVKDDAAVKKWVEELPLSDADKKEVLNGAALPSTMVKPSVPAK